jgi:hypothetical protein
VLDDHAIGAATKGGVLEKAINTFHQLTKPVLEAGSQPNLASGVDPRAGRMNWRQRCWRPPASWEPTPRN